MNSTPSFAGSSPVLSSTPMSNVIDSLKRLERIGLEESQTVQKILEAASELSESICSHVPESLSDVSIQGYVDPDGHIQLGTGGTSIVRSDDGRHRAVYPKHVFRTYAISGSFRRKLFMFQGEDEEPQFVGGGRDVALAFSKDIANGFIELVAQFVQKAHEDSVSGLQPLTDAANSLKSITEE